MNGVGAAIERRGFRKWYEGELLRSHGQLVLLVLATLAALGALEAFSDGVGDRLMLGVSLVVAAAIGAWALRRYIFHLMRAELIANQATCPACHAYGRFAVEREGVPEPTAMTVRCRRCEQRWRIEW
jgi:predicted Zn finger-like uncharacterized protein